MTEMSNSRIIVKNLPGWITEEKLRNVFEQKGSLTDCSIKYNANGKSRRFAFIGYSTLEEAEAAMKYFQNTCIGTSRVKLEVCKSLTDVVSKKSEQITSKIKNVEKLPPKRKNMLPEDLASDPKFAEFVHLHQHDGKVWENDLVAKTTATQPGACADKKDENVVGESSGAELLAKNVSDPAFSDAYTCMVKLKNLPFNVGKEQIKQFFCGLEIKRIVMGAKKRKVGENSVAHVEFNDTKAVDQALRRNKSFLGGRKVLVLRVVRTSAKSNEGLSAFSKKHQPFPQRNFEQTVVDVSDSGRLFVRNLSYLCTEDDIQEIFAKFGELSEVYMPLEKLTKRNKGFAFVSYLLPEHAVKALNELDGTSFQGRMLHIIPAEGKPEKDKSDEGLDIAGSSFKANKEAALKQSANSSHNWNALFVGTNAVIDSVASEYGAEKKQIFEQSGAAVRMALGETEIVLKTKKFLEDHGVRLDAFGKPVVKRSKTIILVKNLPARTVLSELRQLFVKFGTVARLVLPPSGVTALVEFSDSNEAKSAFRALSYRRFKELPLYLEWAPVDVFSTDAPLLKDLIPQEPLAQQEEKPTSANENPVAMVENSAVSVVDDGRTTVFVKNLNFKTTEESLSGFFNAKFPGKVVRATIAKNKDSHHNMMSLGYGFVEFADSHSAQEALKQMQHSELDDHKLELKISTNTTKQTTQNNNKSKGEDNTGGQHPSTRILVRNIPFEANAKDVQELFAVFGSLRSVRLPKKAVVQAVGNVSGRSGGGRSANLHRGFGFVDFHSLEDAKRAFEALRFSTHFYGRRLVLEWAKTDEADLVDELRAKAAERAVASAAAAAGAVHAGAVKRLRKADVVASVEHQATKNNENDDAEMD